MRKLLLIATIAASAGCASSPRAEFAKPRQTMTLAPHALARKTQEQEAMRTAHHAKTIIEGEAVLR